jgi:hypothetical protein
MCNFISFPNKAMTHEPKKNEWIKVIKRKKKERITSNYMAKMRAPKLQVKNLPRTKNHYCEFHTSRQMKKGTTCDFSQQEIYGPKLCQPHLHIHKKPKSIKVFSNKKPLSQKDRQHLKRFDVSESFLHSLNDEPKDTGVQSPFGKY